MLYSWQQPHAQHLLEVLRARNIALDASDTGTGKTFVGSWIAREFGKDPLVICPKSVISSWRQTLEYFKVNSDLVFNIEKLKTGKHPWLIKKNRGKLMTDWAWGLHPDSSFVIWDEVQSAGGIDSQNAKLLALLKPYRIPVLALSATVADSPLRMRALGYHFNFHKFGDFDSWCRQYGCYPSPFARNKLEFPKGRSRITHLSRLHGEIFPRFGGRLRVDELPEFPECVLYAEKYNLAECEAIQAEYDELENSLHDVDDKTPPLVLMNRARENTELLKVPLFEELTQYHRAEGKSVVIFMSYRKPAELLVDRLRTKKEACGFIYGGQSQEERDQEREAFQENKLSTMVIMIQAGGVGISLHDLHGGHPRVSLISPPFSVVHLKQALGRIHRAGAQSKALQTIVFAADTVEEQACEAVRRKLTNLNLLNDGDLTAGLSIEERSTDASN